MGNTKSSNNNNFHGPAQIADGDIINVINEEDRIQLKTARYTPEEYRRRGSGYTTFYYDKI